MGEIIDKHEHKDSCCKVDRELDDELSGGGGGGGGEASVDDDLSMEKKFSLSFEHSKIKLFDKFVSCCFCISLDNFMTILSK